MKGKAYGCRLCGGPLLEKPEKWGIPGRYSADVNYGALSRGPDLGRPDVSVEISTPSPPSRLRADSDVPVGTRFVAETYGMQVASYGAG